MKKTEFSGIDRKIVEDTKAPIEKFKGMDDFYSFCTERIEEIKSKEYAGRYIRTLEQRKTVLQEWFDYVLNENDAYTPSIAFMILSAITKELKENDGTLEQRKTVLQEWFDYVLNENDAYTPSIAFMILSAITKELKENDDTLPPALNKGILAQTVEQIQNEATNQQNFKINFEKEYRVNLQKAFMADETENIDNSLNGWIIIPSKIQDPENFQANVHKLQGLSHNNWCTKGFNAEPYLTEGAFHIYMDNGKPELGCRFIKDHIEEIQGEQNNCRISTQYYDIEKDHIENYKLSSKAEREIIELLHRKEYLKNFLNKNFPNGIEQASTQEILQAFGIEYQKDSDGLLIISHYQSRHEYNVNNTCDFLFFSDLGINENKLFQEIKAIEKDANFSDSKITNLGNLQSIGGNADFCYSKITSLGKLQSIGGNASFWYSKLTSLDNLQSIGGNANFSGSKITTLDNLQSIGGDAEFSYSNVKSLDNLQSIGGNANFSGSKITTLENLQSIGGNAYFWGSQITSLENLQSIGGNAHFIDSQITSLENLQSIGGNAYFIDSQITSLGNLQNIGGNAYFNGYQITSLGNLQNIGGDCYIRNTMLKESDFESIIINGKLNTIL